MAMTVHQWLDKYGESHTNPTNKLIHWICVPIIVWTVFALLYSIPTSFLPAPLPVYHPVLNFATLAALYAIVFYTRLSPPLGAGMVIVSSVMMYLAWAADQALAGTGFPLWGLALIVFFLAWVGQFYGHKVEGAKPSFIDDMKFLLIGPMWLMSFIYRRLGIKY